MSLETIIRDALYKVREMHTNKEVMTLVDITTEAVLEALQEKCPNYNNCTEYIMESCEPEPIRMEEDYD